MKPDPLFSIGTRTDRALVAMLGFVLVALTLAVYLQVANHQFLNLDDNVYVTNNPLVTGGLTGQNIIRAFTSVEVYNWHPLTWLSHMADVQLYGMNPRGHHLTNVALHATAALLLFLLFLRMTGALWQSFFVAALFALHPLHVESVAWVAERKDLLCALFWFLTLHMYADYAATGKRTRYLLALAAFVLALMAKPMAVTLPVIMLLLDAWPLGRYCREERQGLRPLLPLLKEKIPFFTAALASCLITIHAQATGGALASIAAVSLQLRLENAVVATVTYIGKTLCPINLAVLYPFLLAIPLWQVIGSAIILLCVSLTALRGRRRYPFLTLGWFWFIITLTPVIGIIQVGGQAMADRYTYLPVIGLFVMAAWSIPALTSNLRQQKIILTLVAVVVIAASAAATWRQLGYWRDNITLYRHTLAVTTDNYAIHNNLGSALQADGDLDGAIQEYREALRIYPNYLNGRVTLENALLAKRDRDGAISEYRKMILAHPGNKLLHLSLGFALAGSGDLDGALHEYQEALRIDPADAEAKKRVAQIRSRQMQVK